MLYIPFSAPFFKGADKLRKRLEVHGFDENGAKGRHRADCEHPSRPNSPLRPSPMVKPGESIVSNYGQRDRRVVILQEQPEWPALCSATMHSI
jgi:hypothetical protein